MFAEYKENNDDNKIKLSKEILDSINIVLNYDPENEIARQLKASIAADSYLISKSSEKLSENCKGKVKSLKCSNRLYIRAFIFCIIFFIVGAVFYIIFFNINNISKDNLIVFMFTKGTIVSSIIASVFWIAKFLNRRIHENVYLIEEYEYRVLMFDSLENLKVVFGEDITDEVFRGIINKIIENPAINLMKRKGEKSDEIPINFEDLVKLICNNIPK